MDKKMQKLIEKLEQINFNTLDIDELLDNRDLDVFDTEWNRVYREVEELKNAENYTKKEIEQNKKIRRQVFLLIHELTYYTELAEYISDDFGLIFDAARLGYKDLWLDKLVSCYEKGIIPSGEL